MKKLALVVVLVAAFVGWQSSDEPTPTHDILQNRFWVDHLPQGEKDTFRVFALWDPESFGVFATQNHWRLELERFRYEAKDNEIHAIWPLSGDRENFTAKAYRCDEAEMDYCLDISSKHGAKRYYSRHGWVRRDRNVEAFVTSLR